MKLRFAKALPSQHEAIYRLMGDAFVPYVKKLGKKPQAGPWPPLVEALERGDVYVGLEGTLIVGVIATTRRSYEGGEGGELAIEQIGVDPRRQGEGIGSWLLEQIEQTARRQRVKVLSLFTAEMMTGLLRLYARHGFRESRRALPAHGKDQHLRVHMIKRL